MLDLQRAILVERGDTLGERHEFGTRLVGVSFTKVTIACLAGPSCYGASGSPEAADCADVGMESRGAVRLEARQDREQGATADTRAIRM